MLDDLKTAFIFLTRIPLQVDHELTMRDLADASHLFPVVGVVLGCAASAILLFAQYLGMPPAICVILAIATITVLTGALHEDGFADTIDGLGAGPDRERALEIMHDSRVGTFGVIALVLTFSMRFAALTSLAELSSMVVALIAASAVSRAAAATAMALQPPARTSGLVAVAGNPPREKAAIAVLSAAIIAFLILPTGSAFTAIIAVALVGSFAGIFIQHWLGGATGDTLGTIQQITEITFLIALIPSLGHQAIGQ